MQVAVLLFLQRFNVPLPLEEYAKGKWKATMADGKYEQSAVASLTVIIPWYRHCQMERTSRWTVSAEGKWYNGKADGEFVDVPTHRRRAKKKPPGAPARDWFLTDLRALPPHEVFAPTFDTPQVPILCRPALGGAAAGRAPRAAAAAAAGRHSRVRLPTPLGHHHRLHRLHQ